MELLKSVVTENEICEPIGIYGSLKLSSELLIKSYSNVFGLNYTIVDLLHFMEKGVLVTV